MNDNLVKTFVPMFPGFYQSYYSDMVDDEVEHLVERYLEKYPHINRNDVSGVVCGAMEYRAMRRKLALAHAENFISNLMGLVRAEPVLRHTQEPKWCYVRYTPPREYNFETARLLIAIEQDFLVRLYGAVSQYVFSKTVKERHASCSGFISYYCDDATHATWQDPSKFDENQNETLLLAFIEQATHADVFGECVVDETVNDVGANGVLGDCFDYDGIENMLRGLNEQAA